MGEAVGLLELPELRGLLLDTATPAGLKDRCWTELLRCLRRAWDVWLPACLWLALPGLRRRSGLLHRQLRPADVALEDIDGELLTGFLIELQAASSQVGRETRVLGRLLDAASRYALRTLDAGGGAHDGLSPIGDRAAAVEGHPELVLWRAVGAGLICAQDSELIARTRLEGHPLRAEAVRAGVSLAAVSARRRRAELAVANAVLRGEL
ncbi:hypothetical protein Kisp01_70640 [Kineosporia sp. NBRC 101677]|uniref:hypothetical protein n=1 Tax=Kineosporia sp. NBRC 101677 TaxID=3032197 RepID=UPI0024A0D288|nr:hypothetical protein [Kineosporia sp. NBRC 101677]GLY20050.1 hypothetical protein Kisp01_70640 [Kineosporia sp. NBRC 101677]